jgi:hypothetical protein
MATAHSRGVPPMTGAEPRGRAVRTGVFSARALRAFFVLVVGASSWACGSDGSNADVVARISAPDEANEIDEAELPGAAGIAPMLIPAKTYEGSGELVHPDAAYFPRGWQGHRYWLSATPYPGGDARYENPSIFSASSAREMIVPTGASNPLALPETKAYLSDPDLVADPETNELRIYYRQTLAFVDQVYLTTSWNGVQWSKGQLVMTDSRYALISPAIVREGPGAWRMWTVNASVAGCVSNLPEITLQQRLSTDGLTWGAPQPVELNIPNRVPWHWDVQYVSAKREYWALIAAYPRGSSCSQAEVYFARSADGTTWKVSPAPLLSAGGFAPIKDLVYRSTFHYHEGSDAVSVWFSGARLEGPVFHYAVASARYPLAELLRRVGGASAATLGLEQQPSNPSPELEAARARFIADFP